jgi:hypothetical protein
MGIVIQRHFRAAVTPVGGVEDNLHVLGREKKDGSDAGKVATRS